MNRRLAESIRLARYAVGLTQEELAHKSGVSTRTIGDIECGRTGRPRHSTIRRLAQVLNLSAEAITELNLLSRTAEMDS